MDRRSIMHGLSTLKETLKSAPDLLWDRGALSRSTRLPGVFSGLSDLQSCLDGAARATYAPAITAERVLSSLVRIVIMDSDHQALFLGDV